MISSSRAKRPSRCSPIAPLRCEPASPDPSTCPATIAKSATSTLLRTGSPRRFSVMFGSGARVGTVLRRRGNHRRDAKARLRRDVHGYRRSRLWRAWGGLSVIPGCAGGLAGPSSPIRPMARPGRSKAKRSPPWHRHNGGAWLRDLLPVSCRSLRGRQHSRGGIGMLRDFSRTGMSSEWASGAVRTENKSSIVRED